MELLNRSMNVDQMRALQNVRIYQVLGVPPHKIIDVEQQARRLFAEFTLSPPQESELHRVAWATEVSLVIAVLANRDDLQTTLYKMLIKTWERQSDPREPMEILRIKALSAQAFRILRDWKVKEAAEQVAAVARKYLKNKSGKRPTPVVDERSVRGWAERLESDQIPAMILFNEMPHNVFPFSTHSGTKGKNVDVAAKAVLEELDNRLRGASGN
jgi:hypothetical protein